MDEIDNFVSKHLNLLELERHAEIDENAECLKESSSKSLQHRGLLLQRLRLFSRRSGLYGRCICTFQTPSLKDTLPSHRITSGDIVGVCQGAGGGLQVLCSGVVVKTSSTRLKVALEGQWEKLNLQEEHFYSLLKLANDVTYKRLKGALHRLEKPEIRQRPLVEVLFGFRAPESNISQTDLTHEEFLNPGLNEEQRQAVNFALQQKEIAIIHGPPGTGKTTTLIEIILQAVRRKEKVLVCAPSNVAVDNLVERLAAGSYSKEPVRLVRLGHPARVMPLILRHSLDAMMARWHQASLLDDIRKEIDEINQQGCKRPLRARELHQRRHLQTELATRERAAESELLRGVDLVLCTLTSASNQGPLRLLPDDHFALTVIDECSQGLESACWICLPRAPKVVIAGDHLQLPPTIISEQASQGGLSVSLMERLCTLHPEASRMLCMQYRMHTDIMSWTSHQLYQDKLIAHSAVANHLLCDLANVENNDDTSCTLLMVDTAGCQFWETDLGEDQSKGNSGEADIVSIHVCRLIQSGLNPADIAVISPYNLQVEFLRRRLSERFPALEIQSVDGFQGREKEAVVLSLVRSNDKGEVGFLSEKRRINVAVTRARRHLAVFCDSQTVNRDAFLHSLTEHISTRGEVRTAHQYTQELECIEPCSDLLSTNGPHSRPTRDSKPSKKASTAAKNKDKVYNKDQDCNLPLNKKPTAEQLASEEERTAAFEKELQAFVSNPEAESCSFSPKLNSFERRIVHMLCEKLGLIHISKDEDNQRFIEVSKKKSQPQNHQKAPSQTQNSPILNLGGSSTSRTRSDNAVGNSSNLEYSQPKDSSESVQLVTENNPTETIKTASENLTVLSDVSLPLTESKTIRKSKSKAKKQPQKICPEDADDFETLVAAAITTNSRCNQKDCSVSTALLGQMCEHCRKCWCLKHSLPEVHGCGEAAKADARQKFKQGAGPPKVDPTKRVHLQRALEKGLAQMQRKRKGQAK